jgi:hypothetical protein
MKNWTEMTNGEKSLRVGCTVTFAARMAECAQEEDVAGAAICGLSAVAAMGLEPTEIRTILKLLETKANQDA